VNYLDNRFELVNDKVYEIVRIEVVYDEVYGIAPKANRRSLGDTPDPPF
jgi:hypothetical protein